MPLLHFLLNHWAFIAGVAVVLLLTWDKFVWPLLVSAVPLLKLVNPLAKVVAPVVKAGAAEALDGAEKAWREMVAFQLRYGNKETLERVLATAHDIKDVAVKGAAEIAKGVDSPAAPVATPEAAK